MRHYASRPGAAINAEQEFTDDLGGFLRASLNDGHKETYEFTEINRSLVLGLALAGKRWSRPDDTLGLAGVINDISKDARNYLAAGGLGILIGDGALPKAGFEKIALFALLEVPKHASRQLPSGRWTSKLGEMEDVEHDLHDLTGMVYGSVVLVMKRPWSTTGDTL